MYENFFKFRTKPFDLVPNPDFLYPSRTHTKALTYLSYGIREKAGFILLTGEVGSGKTTLIRELLKRVSNRVVLAKVFNTRLDSEQLIAMVNDDFGLPVENRGKVALLRQLTDFLIEQYAQNHQAVLIVDESQNLSPELLEEVRMLSNLETDRAKLLQIILVGQPELRETLSLPELSQLRQRISISHHIGTLSLDETREYVLHRLEVAGNREAVTFAPGVMETIHDFSGGTPRLINVFCDYLLLCAFSDETRDISAELATDVMEELRLQKHRAAECRETSSGNGSSERLERIEKLAADVAAQQKQTAERIAVLEKVCSFLYRNRPG